MLAALGLILLAVWVIARVGPFEVGQAAHLLLLVGLMLLLLAFAKARDAGTRTGDLAPGARAAPGQRRKDGP